MNPKMTIMVVDDEAFTRDAVCLSLRRNGFCAIPSDDATSALEKLISLREEALLPDLVITDLNMPGMSGKDLILKMRAQGMNMRVLMMTGSLRHAELETWKVWGLVSGFLTKPFEERELLEQVLAISRFAEPECGSVSGCSSEINKKKEE